MLMSTKNRIFRIHCPKLPVAAMQDYKNKAASAVVDVYPYP